MHIPALYSVKHRGIPISLDSQVTTHYRHSILHRMDHSCTPVGQKRHLKRMDILSSKLPSANTDRCRLNVHASDVNPQQCVLLGKAYVDFLFLLPFELCLTILQHLDGKSLCRAAQVSNTWRSIAVDDQLWIRMCSQHTSKPCAKCGLCPPADSRSFRG